MLLELHLGITQGVLVGIGQNPLSIGFIDQEKVLILCQEIQGRGFVESGSVSGLRSGFFQAPAGGVVDGAVLRSGAGLNLFAALPMQSGEVSRLGDGPLMRRFHVGPCCWGRWRLA